MTGSLFPEPHFQPLSLSKWGLTQRLVIGETHIWYPNMADSSIYNGKNVEIMDSMKLLLRKKQTLTYESLLFLVNNFELYQVYIV